MAEGIRITAVDALAHAGQVFASAERQVDYLVGCMDRARAEDAGCSRLDHWVPLVHGLVELAPNPEFAYHFLAAAILRLSEQGSADG